MAQAIGILLVTLITTGKLAQAIKRNERQARFQVRCMAHGMPDTGAWFGHECRTEQGAQVVCAGRCDGTGHAVFVDGVQGAQVPTKAAALLAYYDTRAIMYFAHNAQCTPAKAKVRATVLTGAGYTPKGTVALNNGKVITAKGKGKGKGK